MEYKPLGKSGLMVSQYVLGTLTFAGTQGFEAIGSLNDNAARKIIDIAFDNGVNALDTANIYSKGDAERVIGNVLKEKRKEMLIFSKVSSPMGEGINESGSSRAHIMRQIDESLKRLKTDYLDLYFLHRWDGVTPIEETIETMDNLINAGKIRYCGVSNYSGWQVAKTVMTARMNNMSQPVAHQLYYNPSARDAEYELIPAGLDLGLANMVWSPLAQGLLSGKVSRNNPPQAGTRQNDSRALNGWSEPYVYDAERLWRVIDVLKAIAAKHGVSVPQIVLSWIRGRDFIHSIVIGARNEKQLSDNLQSLKVTLDNDDIANIEAAGRPDPLYPFWHRAMWAVDKAGDYEKEFLMNYRNTMNFKL